MTRPIEIPIQLRWLNRDSYRVLQYRVRVPQTPHSAAALESMAYAEQVMADQGMPEFRFMEWSEWRDVQETSDEPMMVTVKA